MATNHGGLAVGADLVFQTGAPVGPPVITAYERLGNGQFRLRFEATSGTPDAVLVSSDLGGWTAHASATETAPGQFEFTDAEAPGQAPRFYQLRSP